MQLKNRQKQEIRYSLVARFVLQNIYARDGLVASALRWPLHIPLTCLCALLWVLLSQVHLFCYTRFAPCSSAGFSFPQTTLRYSLCSSFIVPGELSPSVLGSPADSLATGFFAHASAFPSQSSANLRDCLISFIHLGKKAFDAQAAVCCIPYHQVLPFMPRHGSFLDGLVRARSRLALK